GWLRGADRLATRWPEGGLGVASGAARKGFSSIREHCVRRPAALAGILHSAFPEEWRNPSSAYKFGSKLKRVIETAQPREIIFTSCATENNNAAIHAALKANPGKRHIVTSAVEHLRCY